MPDGIALPPSLVNIYKEMASDLAMPYPQGRSGDLSYLAAQGVLLLNATLTVEAHQAGSPLSAHRGFFGNHHFSRANEYLVNNGIAPIQWL